MPESWILAGGPEPFLEATNRQMLEATVIILDNTEFMRNGDYSPTRLEAQSDAAQLLTNAKLNSNVENSVSIITMGGASPKVMVTLTSDNGKLMHALNSVPFEGSTANLKSALQVAQLVLKHRQNGNQHQRIVAFLGSPLALGREECLALHLALRKNNIALDLVSFGPVTENDGLVETLVWGEDVEAGQAAMEGNEDASHLLRILPGQGSIVEAVASSAVVRGEGAAGGSGAQGGFEFGVDPEMDPELALALKLSMEEEQARQAALSGGKKTEEPEDNGMDVDEAGPAGVDEEDEDALLQQAIALSMQDQHNQQ